MGKGSANFEDWVVSAQKREEEDFLSFFFFCLSHLKNITCKSILVSSG